MDCGIKPSKGWSFGTQFRNGSIYGVSGEDRVLGSVAFGIGIGLPGLRWHCYIGTKPYTLNPQEIYYQ